MIYLITNDVLIILLTLLGFLSTSYPELLVVLSSLLLVTTTYGAFSDRNKYLIIARLLLSGAFSVAAGSFIGFLVFVTIMDIRPYVRALLGAGLYVIYWLIASDNIAKCLLNTIILIAIYVILLLIYYGIDVYNAKLSQEKERIRASNIGELHEKRLNDELIRTKLNDERNARLLERENISRNIHNSVGHSITAAIMTLDAADMLYEVKPEEARKKMNDANERMRGSLESIRRAVRVLDEDNKPLFSKELKEELSMIIDDFKMDTSYVVTENYKAFADDILMPHDYVVFLSGVVKELLTNGVKHGKASYFAITLVGDSAHIRLELIDDGVSDYSEDNCEERIEKGFGIKKIISFVNHCGGKCDFRNEGGFKTKLELPINIAGKEL